jgi:hypothetical protein
MTDIGALFDLEPDWTAAHWTVREAPTTGREWAVRYHYAQRVPAGSVAYGVFCPDMVASVFVGTSVGNVSGVAAKFGLEPWPGNLEITRVICHPDAPKNTASRAIAAVLRYVHRARGVDWVFSYADTGQNHHGGIYQALNAVYVGVNGAARHGYRLDGLLTHPKTIVDTFGTEAWPKAQELARRRGMALEKVEGAYTPKHCYVLPCATPAVNRRIRKALTAHAQPYPRSNVAS